MQRLSLTALLLLTTIAMALPAQIKLLPVKSPVEFHYDYILKPLRDLPTHEARVQFLKQESEKEKSSFFPPKDNPQWSNLIYRQFRSFRLEWECPEEETRPFAIEISETPGFENPITYAGWYDWAKRRWLRYFPIEVYYNNLKIGQTYYWRVNIYSGEFGNFTVEHSESSTFTTADLPPRHIRLIHPVESEGRQTNFRDIGGWKTLDERRVKQGLVFRSEAFNGTSRDNIHRGWTSIAVEDQRFMTETLKIRTDLDLRAPNEAAGMTGSPLGPSVQWLNRGIGSYESVFTPDGKKKLAEVFHVLGNPENYPLVFHCVSGADRTGTLAALLNGLLGVSQHDLECDWETTFLPNLPCLKNGCDGTSRCCGRIFRALEKYTVEGDTLAERIERYLLDCGVTPKEIANIRALLLE